MQEGHNDPAEASIPRACLILRDSSASVSVKPLDVSQVLTTSENMPSEVIRHLHHLCLIFLSHLPYGALYLLPPPGTVQPGPGWKLPFMLTAALFGSCADRILQAPVLLVTQNATDRYDRGCLPFRKYCFKLHHPLSGALTS